MNQKYKQDFLHAGRLAGIIRDFGKSLITPGASYNKVIKQIHQKIIENGAAAAFPPQIALNEVAAHFLPQPDEDIIFTDQLIKLDIGICYKGAIGDCAVTVDLSGKYQTLVEAAEAALLAAENKIQVGVPLGEIGKQIEQAAAAYGVTTIKNLSGHGLGRYKIHTPPSFPNYDNRSKSIIKPGMTFAIEPFTTNGVGFIFESDNPAIFSFVREKPLQSPSLRHLLSKIKTFQGLPFALHDLIDETWPLQKVKEAMHELLFNKVIVGYPPLIEETFGKVAQAENSILVDENGEVIVVTRL